VREINYEINVWLSRLKAAQKISVSVDTIDRRAVEWTADPVPNRIRYRHLKLDDGTRQERRYYEKDVEALLN
jgi:hypothetical protein